MIIQTDKLIASYLEWLKTGFDVKEVSGFQEITTPFLDNKNDHLQIYVSQENGNLRISDGGYTLNDLGLSGVDISTEHRQAIIKQTLNGFGVTLAGEEIIVEANQKNFPQKKHMLIQALLAIGDMYMTSFARIQGIFADDVAGFLKHNEVRFSDRVTLHGKFLPHHFDFVIPSSSKMPERLIRAINTPNADRIKALMWSWDDLRENRLNSMLYAFLNDREKKISKDLVSTIEKNEIVPVLWSNRGKHIEDLVA